METLNLFRQAMVLVVMLSAPPLLVAVGLVLAMTGRWIGVELIQLAMLAFNMIEQTRV